MTGPAKEVTVRATAQKVPNAGPMLPSFTLRAFLRALERLGYDSTVLLGAAGVSRSQVDDPDGLVPCTSVSALICEAIRIRPLSNLGARVAAETPLGAFQLLDYLIVTCGTVAEGVQQLARFLKITSPCSLEIKDDEEPIRLVYLGVQDPFTAEFEVALASLHLKRETENQFRPSYCSFTHAPDDMIAMEKLLDSPVRSRASWIGLAVSRKAWQLPLRRHDPGLHELLKRDIERVAAEQPPEGDIVTQLRHILPKRIAQGTHDVEAVAKSLATSVRSLQRRLSAAGTSYQDIVDSTRRKTAGQYLKERKLSIGEVAYLLGYSEPAAFHRAFRRWYGTTPQEYRSS